MRKNKAETARVSANQSADSGRREFLKEATAAAVALVAAPSGRSQTLTLLPTVPLGPHHITRLISGGNPLYGYSHFNKLYSQTMREYFTDERVVSYLLHCERSGINTWESNYEASRLPGQYPKIQAAGCTLQWICLAAPWDVEPHAPRTPEALLSGMLKCVEVVSKLKPIAIAHHGLATDLLWRAGKLDLIRTFVNKVHDLGFPAGISVHSPVTLEAIEGKNWPHEFYMAALYDQTRRPEEFRKEIGVIPVGETFLSNDPPRMCQVVRRTSKPCLVYKVLAAGRRCGSPEDVRRALEFVFQSIKPTDAIIVGMYPRYTDQVREDVEMVRSILA